MKSFDVKIEKANAISRYRRIQKITTLFRYIEMFVFLIMISRFSSQIPLAVQLSGDYFKGISFGVFSPKFVFVIGNVIISILFLKSRGVENGDGNEKVDFYDEYVKSCEKTLINGTPPPAPTTTITVALPIKEKKICRSRSENLIRAKCEDDQSHRKLRRSATERSRSKKVDHRGVETAAEDDRSYAEDKLSSEEFRLTVEAFIARQQRYLRDEEFSPMVYLAA